MLSRQGSVYLRLLDWADRLMIPLLCCMAIVVSMRMHKGWQVEKLLTTDGEGYYTYLPATLIYGEWQQFDGQDGLQVLDGCIMDSSGHLVTRYTYGVALMEAPFFLGAHAFTTLFQGPGKGAPADWGVETDKQQIMPLNERRYTELRGQATGYSHAYAYAMMLSAVFYCGLGLGFLKRALRRTFRKEVALVATALVFLATNLFYYTAGEGTMSHVYSFCLVAMVIYHVPEWLRAPSWGRSLVLGICFGLIVLIRPTNIFLALLLPLWEVYGMKEIGPRWALLRKHWLKLMVMPGMVALVLLPQGIYWKSAFGSWVAWSYGKEGFSNWAHPEMLKVLFSYQNGLFLYTPIMLLAVVGLVIGWRKRMVSAPLISLLWLVCTYLFASWWAWWFGGAFGHRCFVEWYALLAFPLAMVVKSIYELRQAWKKWLCLALAVVLVYANVKMSMMYSGPWDGPDWTWDDYVTVLAGVSRIGWWPGF